MLVFDKHPRLGGVQLANWTHQAENISLSRNKHGYSLATFFVPMPARQARVWYARLRAAHVCRRERGRLVWEGRIEDIILVTQGDRPGLAITAYSYWRAFNVLNASLWSDTSLERWRPMTDSETGGSARKPDIYEISTDNGRMRLSFKKDEAYAVDRVLTMVYRIPAGTTKTIQSFTWTYSNLVLRDFHRVNVTACDDGLTNLVSLDTINGPVTTAGPVTTTYNFSGTPRQCVIIQLYDTRSAITVNGAGAGPSAGVINLPVSSTTNLFRGQRINIGTDATAEDCYITQIPASGAPAGHVTVNSLACAHVSGDVISYVYKERGDTAGVTIDSTRVKATTSSTVDPQEVIRYFITEANSLNPRHINSLTTDVAAQGIDCKALIYEDFAEMGGRIDELVALGDTSGNEWQAGVGENQVLYARPFGVTSATYQVQTYQFYGTPDVTTTLDKLRSRIIPEYEDANGNRAVGTTQVSAIAEAVNGVARQEVFSAPTNSASDVQTLALARLNDTTVVGSRGEITVRRLYQQGRPVPLTIINPGDIIQCVQLPATGEAVIDRARSFRMTEVAYSPPGKDGAPESLTIMPEEPEARIDTLLARRIIEAREA